MTEPALGQRWKRRTGEREIVLVAPAFGGGWSYVTVVRERSKWSRYTKSARKSRGGYQISDAGLTKKYQLVVEDPEVVAARVAKLRGAT